MSAIDALFARLRSERRKAFMPFITAGDPDLEFTAEVIRRLAGHGSHLCEVGIPYSDPVADGPVIQASYTRALNRGVRVSDILKTLGQVAPQVDSPLLTMVSYAIIYRMGHQAYVTAAQQSGIAGLIVPDLPVEEAGKLAELCRAADISLVQLITPTTTPERARRIADQTTGFIYYVSVAGITGERRELPPELIDKVSWLREQTPLPVCIGFGISQPEHVRMLAPVADGLIVGSAIVRRIAEVDTVGREETLKKIGTYVDSLLEPLVVPAK